MNIYYNIINLFKIVSVIIIVNVCLYMFIGTQNEFNVVDNNENDKEIHVEKKTLRLKTLEADIKKIKKQEKRNIVPLLPKMPTLHSKDEERLKPKLKFSQTNQKWFYEKRNSSCDTEKNKHGNNKNNQQHILLIEKNEKEEDNNNDENMSNNTKKKNIIEVEQKEEVITEDNKDKKEKKKGKNTSRKRSVDHIKIDYSDKDRETIEQEATERNVFKVKDRKIILTTFGCKDDNNHNKKVHFHKSAQSKKHKKIHSFQKFQIFKFNSTNKFPLKPETIAYNSKQIDCPEEQHFVNVNSIKIKRMAFL